MTDFADVLAWLGSPGTLGGRTPERIDTHAAVVFLTEDAAWKLKRPVRFAYLDFSTLERRRQMLRRELEINRTFAPDLYVGLQAITRDAAGNFVLGGDGTVVEWVLRMRRFPAQALLSSRVSDGRFGVTEAARLGACVAQMHRQLAPVEVPDGAARMADVWQSLLAGLETPRAAALPAGSATATESALRLAIAQLAECLPRWQASHATLLQARARAGWVRRCHGDLHLGNLVWLDDHPVAFDALEFDETLSTIDVWYDIAFVLMDLLQHGKVVEAGVVRDRYLLAMATDDAWRGLALLPGFMAVRAAVRALVALQKSQPNDETGPCQGARDQALRYLNLALTLLAPVSPRLLAVGGLSGSGKSTVAAALAPHLVPLPGAVHLRTDLIRKQRWGCAETGRLPEAAYTAAVSRDVYEQMWHEAGLVLQAGSSVVLDAVHLQPWERERTAAVAHAHGVAFQGVWLEAPLATLQARVAARRDDASDATEAVVQRQAACDPGAIAWPRTTSAAVLAAPAAFIR